MRSPLLFALALGAVVATTGAAQAEVLRLDGAEVAVGGPDEPPSGPGAWAPVALPHRWAGAHDAAPATRWYRLELPALPGPQGLTGVLLPDVAMNAEVRWNGAGIGDGGRFEAPIAQNFHRPLYFRVPAGLVRAEGNELLVRVATAPHFYGWLGPVSVGPDALLAPAYERELLWRLTLPRATSVLAAVAVLLLAAFWLASRDALYAWLVVVTACWAVGNLNLHVRDLPLPTMPFARGVQLAVAWGPIAFVVYTHRLLGLERTRLEHGLAGYAAGLLLLALLMPSRLFLPTFTALHVAGLGLAGYALVAIGRRLRSLSKSEVTILGISGALLLAIGLHDIAIQFGEREGAPRYWTPLSAPVFILSFSAMMTLRFVRAFLRAARHNEELEERVRQKHAELEANFARLRGLEDDRVLVAERDRMMREMHDGLGGRLVETLGMVEGGDSSPAELAATLRAALDEMRLLIDSLDPEADDLPLLLGRLRDRLEPSLRRSGVRLDWKVGDLSAAPALGPQEGLHVLRIVQEALTNVAKHAGASRVEFGAEVAAGADGAEGVRIEFSDDGRGFDATAATRGRGLGNMRRRAAALGGTLAVESGAGGTSVELWIPARSPAQGSTRTSPRWTAS